MKNILAASLVCIGGLLLNTSDALAQANPIDLNSWNQEGNPSNGNWAVSSDGNSVSQSINGNPTFFVSPDDLINNTFNGSFGVQTSADDDYIGFVFGYQSPLSANSDSVNDYNFLLFDWKQQTQPFGVETAQEGFSLNLVNGNISNFLPGFWGHNDSPEFNVLATDYGATRGWADNTVYDFTLLYQDNRIKIDIEGGTGDFANGQTIFDITPGDVGLTSFQAGKFGFYNYSQQNVLYQGFTSEVTPPDTDPVAVPEPASIIGLLGVGLIGLTSRRKNRL